MRILTRRIVRAPIMTNLVKMKMLRWSIVEGNRKENCVKQNEEENADSCYDKPVEDCCNGDFYDTPSTVENSGEFYDKPSKQFSLASLSDNNTESQENLLYDQPRGSGDGLYDRPKGSDENVYDKPPAKPKRTESFRNSDPTVSEKVNKLRPQLKTRASAPAFANFHWAAFGWPLRTTF